LHEVALPVLEDLLDGRPDHVELAATPVPRAGEVDLFHATSWVRPPTFDGLVLMTCYDLTVLSHPRAHVLTNRVHCLTGLLDAHLAGDAFLTLSRATARELQTFLEIAESRIQVIPAAVDDRFQPLDADTAEPALAALGIAPPYVLAVGTREPRKNLGRLLDAWHGLDAAIHSTTPLVIVGAAGWGDDAERSRLETTEGVRLLGHVEDALLAALYARASVFVYPSLAEGFGFPVLEAMACGAPVITSEVSSMPEVAGDAALLVDPLDTDALRQALATVLGDSATVGRLRSASLKRAKDFSWRQTAQAVLGLYDQLLTRQGGG
jgi:alpha-1,3-rhamnosyl/mannosyltransferase